MDMTSFYSHSANMPNFTSYGPSFRNSTPQNAGQHATNNANHNSTSHGPSVGSFVPQNAGPPQPTQSTNRSKQVYNQAGRPDNLFTYGAPYTMHSAIRQEPAPSTQLAEAFAETPIQINTGCITGSFDIGNDKHVLVKKQGNKVLVAIRQFQTNGKGYRLSSRNGINLETVEWIGLVNQLHNIQAAVNVASGNC